jgi:hypothetical protein
MYLIKNENDHYLKISKNNIITVVENVKNATTFDNFFTPQNVVKNNLKKRLALFQWDIIQKPIEEIHPPIKHPIVTMKSDCKIECKTENINSTEETSFNLDIHWFDKVRDLKNFQEETQIKLEEMIQKHSNIDLELSDIYHFVKDNNPPAHVRTKVYSIQQEKLKQRELIKHEISLIQTTLSVFNANMKNGTVFTNLKQIELQPYKKRTEVYDQLSDLLTPQTRKKKC